MSCSSPKTCCGATAWMPSRYRAARPDVAVAVPAAMARIASLARPTPWNFPTTKATSRGRRRPVAQPTRPTPTIITCTNRSSEWTGWSLVGAAARTHVALAHRSGQRRAGRGAGRCHRRGHDAAATDWPSLSSRRRAACRSSASVFRIASGRASSISRATASLRRIRRSRTTQRHAAGHLLALRAGRSAGARAPRANQRRRVARAHGDPQQLECRHRPPISRRRSSWRRDSLPASADFEYTAVNERHAVPPKSSQLQCEQHGCSTRCSRTRPASRPPTASPRAKPARCTTKDPRRKSSW